MQLKDEKGRALDAKFHTADGAFGASAALLIDSRGAGRNNDYSEALTLAVWRIHAAGFRVAAVTMESATTRKLGLAERRIQVPSLKVDSAEKARAFRCELGRSVARFGRPPGAKGNGNAQKRIALHVVGPADGAELWANIEA